MQTNKRMFTLYMHIHEYTNIKGWVHCLCILMNSQKHMYNCVSLFFHNFTVTYSINKFFLVITTQPCYISTSWFNRKYIISKFKSKTIKRTGLIHYPTLFKHVHVHVKMYIYVESQVSPVYVPVVLTTCHKYEKIA
jgi:hypothetical protein